MEGSTATTENIFNSSNLVFIGENAGVTGRQFIGLMDEVRIWNVNRSEAQIKSNFLNELTGNETGLVSYFKFNNTVASGTNSTTVSDVKNANNGTAVNFALTGATSNYIANTNDGNGTIVSPNGTSTSLKTSTAIAGDFYYYMTASNAACSVVSDLSARIRVVQDCTGLDADGDGILDENDIDDDKKHFPIMIETHHDGKNIFSIVMVMENRDGDPVMHNTSGK